MADPSPRLSLISTAWTLLRQAHTGPAGEQAAAKEGGAVRRYLHALLKDPHAADDLGQEFAVRLLQGGFHAADRERGRFRNYVKTTLFNLVAAHRRKAAKGPAGGDTPLAEVPDRSAEADERAFADGWRAELLWRVWEALKAGNSSLHDILRLRVENPAARSDDLAARLTAETGRPYTAAGVRQAVKRARDRFAELLRDEVAHSLDDPTPDAVEAELAELRLLEYVRGDKDDSRLGSPPG
jgi:RNA polymerase sigma-70 factor (ECF subfamily)